MKTWLKKVTIEGFKSIGRKVEINPRKVTVLLGANGSGKSNLVSFFRMVNHISSGALQKFVAESGMANSVLYFGSERTKSVSFTFEFESDGWTNEYAATLAYYAPDGLFFTEERTNARKNDECRPIEEILPVAGRLESQLGEGTAQNEAYRKTRSVIARMLKNCKAFQFHNTTPESAIRNSCYIENGGYLRGDAGNLPAFLYEMRRSAPEYYKRIVVTIREMVPQFRDFSLKPSVRNPNRIFLDWIGERGDEYLLGPHQFSDGSIRFIALASLLLQPEKSIPSVIILDEPELGLHPAAIKALAGMIQTASQHSQILLSTQSAELASLFELEDICIVNYDQAEHTTTFQTLPVERLRSWLDDYSLAELWEKNLLGGRP